MRILNWNTQFVSPRARTDKFEQIRALVASYDADVVCLTEAYPEAMPAGGQAITSEISSEGKLNPEKAGARKVVLWSRFGWSNVDTLGSPNMPPGRFIKAASTANNAQWTIVGMCIPYANYRTDKKWGEKRMAKWQGACRYLDALREDVLPALRKHERVILPGDFNMQIPPSNYPYPGNTVNQKRKGTFDGWLIPTAGIDRRFIDHIAMSKDLRVDSMQFVSRFDADGTELSDHNGVVIDIGHC